MLDYKSVTRLCLEYRSKSDDAIPNLKERLFGTYINSIKYVEKSVNHNGLYMFVHDQQISCLKVNIVLKVQCWSLDYYTVKTY